uniref:Uncharacterized protein n=1 Tax=Knipowitschia caucasica TaxID=637954 RepID=A0AAV2M2K9_KNICA
MFPCHLFLRTITLQQSRLKTESQRSKERLWKLQQSLLKTESQRSKEGLWKLQQSLLKTESQRSKEGLWKLQQSRQPPKRKIGHQLSDTDSSIEEVIQEEVIQERRLITPFTNLIKKAKRKGQDIVKFLEEAEEDVPISLSDLDDEQISFSDDDPDWEAGAEGPSSYKGKELEVFLNVPNLITRHIWQAFVSPNTANILGKNKCLDQRVCVKTLKFHTKKEEHKGNPGRGTLSGGGRGGRGTPSGGGGRGTPSGGRRGRGTPSSSSSGRKGTPSGGGGGRGTPSGRGGGRGTPSGGGGGRGTPSLRLHTYF